MSASGKIATLYWEDNLTAAQIAVLYGKSPSWVYKMMRDNKIPRRRPGTKSPLSPVQLTEICDLYRTGEYTQQEIADKFGVTRGRIQQILQAKDVPTRGRGTRTIRQIAAREARREQRQIEYELSRCSQCRYHRMPVGGGVCESCERGNRIVAMWREDRTMPEISAALKMSKSHLGCRMARMRKAGWDLPHRRPPVKVAA